MCPNNAGTKQHAAFSPVGPLEKTKGSLRWYFSSKGQSGYAFHRDDTVPAAVVVIVRETRNRYAMNELIGHIGNQMLMFHIIYLNSSLTICQVLYS